ncbi:similar to Saccharomyces cerevisiae YER175C TMT1 Trans-aconitate methyltransferase [Maudiozyma saulgeensis]|uniref:Similar to Saccharomyces cerevisiae YER175C TMT1 Trans-aconitate methyltransferase n=1 Tax=Maudiozyma saulgeensis TaxID=1789683 RepID=A0A1X7R7M7_9SACH|nr:similar to Saccharomyces cerevisiae YER175C TMT1 Trans-aconitate methyltransferase [Kazachstania saulgeensis]
MSQFSEADFGANGYSSARPDYPETFYKFLSNYHSGSNSQLVDVGCGPGTATFQLVKWLFNFSRFIGTDLSPPMINRANELAARVTGNSNNQNNSLVGKITFHVAACTDFSFLENKSCDMITAAECAHWFDFDAFQLEASKNLSSGGTIAIWGYIDSVLEQYPDTDSLMLDLQYGENKLGPYWEQPGRSILRGLLQDRHLNPELYERIEESHVMARDQPSAATNDFPLLITKEMPLSGYLAYLKTCSAYHAWQKDPKNQGSPDPCDELITTIQAMHPELKDLNYKVRVTWSSFYKVGTRRA